MKNIKIGADPELFLAKDGEIISAEGMIGGTKLEPQPISDDGHCIQEDNIMIEFNIPPCETEDDFVSNINFVKGYLQTLANLKGCTLDFSASAELNKKYLRTTQAKQFGCEPDYNVYLRDINTPPASNGVLRSCGGHIHIGYDNPNQGTTEKIVKAMDITLGLESVLLDKDDRRKEMYGKAGAFRFKDYGLEYRTLSNFWISDDNLIKWAFNQTMKAIELVTSGKIDNLINEYSKFVKEAIDNNNKDQAASLLMKIREVAKIAA